MKSTVDEYREDLVEILDAGLDHFVRHCVSDAYSDWCLLDESEHDEVIRRVNTFRLEMEAFIAKAKAVPRPADYSPPAAPENTDVTGLLARLRQGPPHPA